MDRERVGPVVVALLSVLALAVAAASLDTATTAGGGVGAGDDRGVGVPGGSGFDTGSPNATADVGDGSPLPDALYRVLAVVVFGLLLAGVYATYRSYGSRGLAAMVGGSVGVGLVVYLLYRLFEGLGRQTRGDHGLFGEEAPSLPGGGAVGPAATDVSTTSEPTALLGLAVVVLVVAGAVLVRSWGGGDDPDRSTGDEPDVAAVGRAAGRAADRIARDADATNEVYRAWREMTDHLDVPNPAASTPAEFAGAAVEAGMDREAVDELTGLFEAVRYGGRDPDERRERRALAALRRIERAHADGRRRVGEGRRGEEGRVGEGR